MPFFLFDPTMLIALPGLIFTLWAQAKVQSAFSKYSRVAARSGVTGSGVARDILNRNGLSGVAVEPVRGQLTDHYDPRAGVLRLSESVYGSRSIAALGIAAHETGHALQHSTNYSALVLRTAVAPAAATGSKLGLVMFFIGFLIPMFVRGMNMNWLMDAGIIFFSASVFFTLVTLPVEFNASKRALVALEKGGYLTADEIPQAKKVLDAAAWTYVAAAATGSKLGLVMFFIGFLLPMFVRGMNMTWLMDAGIIFFSASVLFTLITLPVEFNASKRALVVLEKGGYLTADEIPQAKKVLDAAAWTYVAAAATTVLMLIRLLVLRGNRD